jgi:tight adherence protein B
VPDVVPFLLSVSLGAGVYLIYDGLTQPRPLRSPLRLTAVEEFLTRAGLYGVSAREFVLFSLLAGIIAGVLAQLTLGWPLVTALAAGLAGLAPAAYYFQRHERRRASLQLALVDAISQLRDAIRTGLSLQEGLRGLAHTGPERLRPEFEHLSRDARLFGFERAIGNMKDRLADPVFDMVAVSLLLNEQLGGRNVTQVLDRLASATRRQQRLSQELRAGQAENVASARFLAALPLGLIFVIRQIRPDYLHMFNDLSGQMVLAACVVSIAVGYAAMRWITRLPGEPRVLR